jgi:predicted transposase/invertase (TIGR01784 family)
MDIEEIQEMFGLSDLKQTRVYQQAFAEGEQKGERRAKLKTVPRFLALGLTIEQIAIELDLNIEEVSEAAQQQSSS